MKKEVWQLIVDEQLQLFGHRNWIIIADYAYPAHSSSSIETIFTHAEHTNVIEYVLQKITELPHIKPNIYLDKEFDYIFKDDAPGISDITKSYSVIFKEYQAQKVLHDDFFPRLDKASNLFKVLVLKTTLCIPYTSVFIELDCGYWDARREEKLRDTIKNKDETI